MSDINPNPTNEDTYSIENFSSEPLTLINLLNQRLQKSSIGLQPNLIYTSSLAVMVGFLITLVLNYKKSKDEEHYINTVLKPKMIKNIQENIKKDNERIKKLIAEKQDKLEQERLEKEAQANSQRTLSDDTVTMTNENLLKDDDESPPNSENINNNLTELEILEQEIVKLQNEEENELRPTYNTLVANYQDNQNALTSMQNELNETRNLSSSLQKESISLDKKLLSLKKDLRSIEGQFNEQKKMQRKHNENKSKNERKLNW